MRRAQASVIAIALLVPACALGLVGLACLGARVQGELAQRRADTAALRSALNLPVEDRAAIVTVTGERLRAHVALTALRLRLPLVGEVTYTAQADAMARATTTADGRDGAVLIG